MRAAAARAARAVRTAVVRLLIFGILGLMQLSPPVQAQSAPAPSTTTTATTTGSSTSSGLPPRATSGPRTYQLEAIVPITSSLSSGAVGAVMRAVAATDEGGAFVVGDFKTPTVRLGNVTLTNLRPPSADLFVARLDPNGAVAWAFAWGGDGDDFGRCVAWDSRERKVYLVGDFQSSDLSVTDGEGRRVGLEKGAGPDTDVVVARLDGATGAVEWLTKLGDETGNDAGTAVLVDPQRRALVHVAGWFDFHDHIANRTQRDTFVTVLDAASGEELVEHGQFWTGDGDEVLTALSLSPSDGMLYVGGVSDSAELVLDMSGGILAVGGGGGAGSATSLDDTGDGKPRAFLVAINTRRREVAWSLALGEVAPTALSKEPDSPQSLPLAGFTGVAIDPTNMGSVYVSGAFTSPEVLRLLGAQASSAGDAPQAAALLHIDVGQRAIIWAGLPASVTPGVEALAVDVYGFLYTTNEREVIKLGHIDDGNPAAVVARQALSRCGNGPADLAVDLRGSAYVACLGGSVARAMVQSSYTLPPTPAAPTVRLATAAPTISPPTDAPVASLSAAEPSNEAAAVPDEAAKAAIPPLPPASDPEVVGQLDGQHAAAAVAAAKRTKMAVIAGVVVGMSGLLAAAFLLMRRRGRHAGPEGESGVEEQLQPGGTQRTARRSGARPELTTPSFGFFTAAMQTAGKALSTGTTTRRAHKPRRVSVQEEESSGSDSDDIEAARSKRKVSRSKSPKKGKSKSSYSKRRDYSSSEDSSSSSSSEDDRSRRGKSSKKSGSSGKKKPSSSSGSSKKKRRYCSSSESSESEEDSSEEEEQQQMRSSKAKAMGKTKRGGVSSPKKSTAPAELHAALDEEDQSVHSAQSEAAEEDGAGKYPRAGKGKRSMGMLRG